LVKSLGLSEEPLNASPLISRSDRGGRNPVRDPAPRKPGGRLVRALRDQYRSNSITSTRGRSSPEAPEVRRHGPPLRPDHALEHHLRRQQLRRQSRQLDDREQMASTFPGGLAQPLSSWTPELSSSLPSSVLVKLTGSVNSAGIDCRRRRTSP
jgi:hypothetical protein